MAQHCHQRLGPRVDAAALAAKRQRTARAQLLLRRQFLQLRLLDDEIEAGIATLDRVADPIGLGLIEEQQLVGFGDRIVAADMAHEDTAIGKHQMRGGGAFFFALVPAFAAADDVPYPDGAGVQERLYRELRHGRCVPFAPEAIPAL